jgi:transposase-like protein
VVSRWRTLPPERRLKIVELHEKHEISISSLAQRFGVSQFSISRILREYRKRVSANTVTDKQ